MFVGYSKSLLTLSVVVPCKDCDKCYVGQTGRQFETRMNEHKSYITKRQYEKAVYNHVLKENHAIDFNGAKMVFGSSNEKQRLVVESALILELPNFNLCKGASSINKASKDVILSKNKWILDNVRRDPT